jgi:hypothetical protein
MPRSVLVQRVLGLAAAVVFAAGSLWALGRTPEPRPVATSAAPTSPSASLATPTTTAPTDSTASASPGPSGPSAASGPSALAPPSSPGSAPVATSGPGLTGPGIHVVAQAGADGALEVVERVRLPAPVSVLVIALPRASGSGVASAAPTISGFQAQAGGQVVTDTLASPLPNTGDQLDLPAPSSDITMRYRLEGGAERSQPAPVGRALVVLPPVTAARPALAGLPVVVEVVGGNIRNLVCPELDARDQLCGRQRGSLWSTAAIPLGRSVVVAQMDLPAPGAG